MAEPQEQHEPQGYVPRPLLEYKPPHMVAEHWRLALVFALVIIAAVVYLVRAPHKPFADPPIPVPVYIDPIPVGPIPSTSPKP